MKTVKQLLCLLLAICLAGALFAGCADSAGGATPSDTVSPSASGDAAGGFVFDFSAPLDDEGFFKGVKASELVTLPEYKNLSIPASVLTAAEADVQEQLDSILSKHAVAGDPIMDRAVEDGDKLNIDYVGSVDGVEFEGGNTGGTGTEVTIGVTQYIDDFLEQLIGHMPGETFDIEVTFPDPYLNNPDLAGKDAVFNVTINHIVGESIVPELSDEIAAEYNFATAEELVADIESWLISTQKSNYFKELLQGATVSQVPDAVMDYIRSADMAYYEYYAASYNTDAETLLTTMTGYSSMEDYQAAQESFYQETALFYLACQALAEQEGLKATDEDVETSGYADGITMYGEPYIRMFVLQEIICRDFVFDHAVIA